MITNLIYYRHNHTQPCGEIPRARCAYHELTLVLKGEITYAVDDEFFTLYAGDVIYIPTDHVRYRRKATENTDYVSFNFLASEPIFPTFHLKGCVEDVCFSLIHAIDCVFSRTINLTDPRFSSLFESLLLQLKAELTAQTENRVSLMVKQYVKTHLAEKISLDELSKIVFLSPNYCDRIFKKETGQSIGDYILDKRVEYAKNLLWDLALPLATVAKTVGFSDYGYFCRIFKKRTGYSPLQFRKQTQGKNK
jgi:AraC-like DNA-binding protein